MTYIAVIAVAVISYLIGSINFSIILSKAMTDGDIRKSGSGNAGATNMLRTHGKKMGLTVLMLDVIKGVLAITTATIFSKLAPEANNLRYIAAVFVVLGHIFPVFFGFKGGKGVATALGVMLLLDFDFGVLILIIAVMVIAATNYVSLGSIVGSILFILVESTFVLLIRPINWGRLVYIIVLGGLIIFSHRKNIVRLIKGEENKLSFKK